MKELFKKLGMGSFVQDRLIARTFYGLLLSLAIGLLLAVILPFPLAILGLIVMVPTILLGWWGLKFAKDPEEGLVLTCSGQIVERDVRCDDGTTAKETVTATGWFIVPVWPPFFVGGRKIDLSMKEWDIPAVVLSVERLPANSQPGSKPRQIPMAGVITLTIKANRKDAKDFLVASNGGDFDNLKRIVDDIAINTVKDIIVTCRNQDGGAGLSAVEISQRSKIISDELEKRLNGYTAPNGSEVEGIIYQKALGFDLEKVQFEAPLPAEMQTSMIKAGSIEYDNAARLAEMAADVEGARIYSAFGVTDPERALNNARQDRLIRDEASQQLIITSGFASGGQGHNATGTGQGGGVGTVVLTGTNINFGKPKDKKKEN